jgi:hypothetical protein
MRKDSQAGLRAAISVSAGRELLRNGVCNGVDNQYVAQIQVAEEQGDWLSNDFTQKMPTSQRPLQLQQNSK